MMIVIHENESGMKILTKSNPIKFKGGPGSAGIMQPAIPRTERKMAITIINVSIFSFPFCFDSSSWYHNAF